MRAAAAGATDGEHVPRADTVDVMSGDNVERFHRLYREFYEHHGLGPDLLADDAEWINPPDAVEPGIRHGADSFNRAIRSIFDAWGEVRFEADRVIGDGDDVIAVGYVRGRGRGAGVEVRRPHGEIWTFREGKVVRLRWFHTHAETFEAADIEG
jgi:ketosteroid isomerase-like protein